MYDNEMKFVDTHEWIKSLGETGVVLVGITHHAQELLGDMVYLELPGVGQTFTVGETIGVVESVKAASDLYAPVSGEVLEINEAAVADPTIINSDPHGEGWMIKVKLSDVSELDKLLTADKYKSLIG